MPDTDTRWLVYDRREELVEAPGTHALVIGLSAYRYLPERTGEAISLRTFGLHQLTSAARSAYVFHNWLRKNADRLAIPLKTLRLLLAPSPEEVAEIEDLDRSRTDCGFKDLTSAVYAWREDASRDRDDVTVFYFCGNGFDLGPSDPVIALADFGAPRGPALSGTIAVNHLIQGLAPSDWLPQVARTQLYVIDAGRRRMSFGSERVIAPPVFDLPPPWLDDRRLAVCHASSPGQMSWAVRGGTTFLLLGLLRCLEGEAAVPDLGDAGPSGHPWAWRVTVNSLIRALPAAVEKVAKEAGFTEEQHVFASSMSGDAVILDLDSPPLVPVTVEFDAVEAAERAVFDIRQADGTPVDVRERGRTPGRRELILPAGLYLVLISFRPVGQTTEPAEKDVQFVSTLMPPEAVWSVQAHRESTSNASAE